MEENNENTEVIIKHSVIRFIITYCYNKDRIWISETFLCRNMRLQMYQNSVLRGIFGVTQRRK
jgi:hypothetical protein